MNFGMILSRNRGSTDLTVETLCTFLTVNRLGKLWVLQTGKLVEVAAV
jgi:hypothetical protein